MSKIFFTADTHFGHTNIIKYCNRPFKSKKHMDNILIGNWNRKVKKNDIVIINGDFCLCNNGQFHRYVKFLNGKKIFLTGSHGDKVTKAIINNMEIEYGGHKFFITHDPKNIDFRYKINLTAHVHRKWEVAQFNKYDGFGEFNDRIKVKESKINDIISGVTTNAINIGVDVWNYSPVSIDEILNRYRKFCIKYEINCD